MKERNYLETEEYKNMIRLEKNFFKNAIKILENKDIEILYFDKENIAYKKYQKLRFETQKYYIDGFLLVFSILFSVTMVITTEVSKVIPYKFAKILGSITGIIALYLYGIFF